MAEVWWAVEHFVTVGGRVSIGWAAWASVAIAVASWLVVLGRLSTHSYGPLSGSLFVLWYIALLTFVIAPTSNISVRSIITFYPRAFVALLVLIFILKVRRAELDANQRKRNRRSAEAIARALTQVAVQTPDARTPRNAPKFSLYLRPFASTNELPVQFDHGRNKIIGERIDLERILQLSLVRSGLFIAVGRSDDDIIGADRVESTDDWHARVADLINRADRIFVLPSHHKGTLWEIEWLVKNRRLANCIWIMPECVFRKGTQVVVTVLSINWFQSAGNQAAVDEAKMEWSRATNAVKAFGVHLPAHREEGLLFKMDDAGQVVASEPLNLRNTLGRVRKVRRLIRRLQG